MVSTRGRYAIRLMIDLAEHQNGMYIPIKTAAARQGISLKYAEKIMPLLVGGHLVEGAHGKGGGYRLCRAPDACTVWEILCLTEGELSPVSCLCEDTAPCARAPHCRTLPMWREYARLTREYFSGITLADLMRVPLADDYVI